MIIIVLCSPIPISMRSEITATSLFFITMPSDLQPLAEQLKSSLRPIIPLFRGSVVEPISEPSGIYVKNSGNNSPGLSAEGAEESVQHRCFIGLRSEPEPLPRFSDDNKA